MDEYQIHIPPSFEALYRDTRGRLTVARDGFRDRYELCEDMAQLLIERSQQVHHDQGISEDIVLQRTLTGLANGASGFSGAEAGWVTTRLAELLGWPWRDLPVAPEQPGR